VINYDICLIKEKWLFRGLVWFVCILFAFLHFFCGSCGFERERWKMQIALNRVEKHCKRIIGDWKKNFKMLSLRMQNCYNLRELIKSGSMWSRTDPCLIREQSNWQCDTKKLSNCVIPVFDNKAGLCFSSSSNNREQPQTTATVMNYYCFFSCLFASIIIRNKTLKS
jgi:hypothetical protein